jgi:hypothetical protein
VRFARHVTANVYRKLGVRRAELAGRLAIPVDEAAEL